MRIDNLPGVEGWLGGMRRVLAVVRWLQTLKVL
jgi:hypothetical protein